MHKNTKISIFYDGKCHLCSREIEGYRRRDRSNRLGFIDISSAGFNALEYGLDSLDVKKVLHVQRSDGTVVKGVDAFIEIWRTLEMFEWLALLVERYPTRLIFQGAYAVFARLRPLLPQKGCSLEQKI